MRSSRVFFSYFPQYHPDPLNDRAWGPGFTDWDLIRALPEKIRRRFTPAIGFYDPSSPEYVRTLIDQLERLPFSAGLMVYHYHFDGVYALSGFERQWLQQRPEVPFFLCWANETWTKRWVGRPSDIIVEQKHLADEALIRAHARYLSSYFELPSYRRIDDRPLLLIYNPLASPTLPRSIGLYRNAFQEIGWVPMIGACVSHSQPASQFAPYDFVCEFQPRYFFNTSTPSSVAKLASHLKARLPTLFEWMGAQRDRLRQHTDRREFSYEKYLLSVTTGDLEKSLRATTGSQPLMRSTFLSWDNSPRYGDRSTRVTNASGSPIDFAAVSSIRSDGDLPVLVNSWNEWSEGAALEPGVTEHAQRSAFLGAIGLL